jgi:hypothetical protein
MRQRDGCCLRLLRDERRGSVEGYSLIGPHPLTALSQLRDCGLSHGLVSDILQERDRGGGGEARSALFRLLGIEGGGDCVMVPRAFSTLFGIIKSNEPFVDSGWMWKRLKSFEGDTWLHNDFVVWPVDHF